MSARFFVAGPMAADAILRLPEGSARHVQVLRMQPGQQITLFNGEGGEWDATITHMGRSDVDVRLVGHRNNEREPTRAVHLALGMPANERMDWLVEKAAELGVRSVQPLQTSRSVLRLSGERAGKKQSHWQAVAMAACEQCGGNRVPALAPVLELPAWLQSLPSQDNEPAHVALRCVLSLAEGTQPLSVALGRFPPNVPVYFLSGPEGGLSAAEEALAKTHHFVPVSLGPRVLRAETAALTALVIALQA